MTFTKWLPTVSAALIVSLSPFAARAADKVVIGDSALGQPIEFLTADHQNKPDIGASKFREWADTKGLTMLLGGSNTGVSLALAPIAKDRKIPFFAVGAAGASLTGKDCNAYMIH